MSNNSNKMPQSSLILRILGGGYLVYLAWDLRGSFGSSPLFTIAVIVFGLVGLVLFAHSLWTLITHEYFRKTEPKNSEEYLEGTEDSE